MDIVVDNPAGVAPLDPSYTTLNSGGASPIMFAADNASSTWEYDSILGGNPSAAMGAWTTNQAVKVYSSTSGCDQDIDGIWDDAAKQLGYADAQTYLDSAPTGVSRHLLVLMPPGCSSYETGTSTVGDGIGSGGLVEATMGLTVDSVLIAQGLGHNFGVGDADLDVCDDDSLTLGCTRYDGGDLYDFMGAPIEGYDVLPSLNAATRASLGWDNPSDIASYSLPDGVDTKSWTVNIMDAAWRGSASSPAGLELTDPLSGDKYYVSYRGAFSGYNEPFFNDGPIYSLGEDSSGDVRYSEGIQLLQNTDDGGTTLIAQPDLNYDYNDSTAFWGSTAQNDTVSNPSGTIRVQAFDGGIGTGVHIQVTLTRPSSAPTTPIYRFWSASLGAHFYTADPAERDHIIATWPATWSYEGTAYNAYSSQVAGTVPLYRFWSAQFGDHFYTTSAIERDYIKTTWPTTWSYEGTAYYVYPVDSTSPNTVSVARFWSPTLRTHFYTDDPTERNTVLANWPNTWSYEDNEFRVPAPANG
jgi:hypothetical protein